jgi:hypothetical protein
MPHRKLSRTELIRLAKRIQDAQDLGEDWSDLLQQLEKQVPFPHVGDLFLGDHSAEYIIDFSLNWQAELPKPSKEEMIALVTRIVRLPGGQAELGIMVQQFIANCVHPAKTDLIYYPAEHFNGNSKPTPEQIVEKAMTGK